MRAAALVLLLAPRSASSEPPIEDLLAKVVRARYEALHACFRRSLADDRSRGGTIFVRLTIGAHERVSGAKLERDELKHPPTVRCLIAEVVGWTLKGITGAGVGEDSELVLPLTFRADPQQRVVSRADATVHAIGDGDEAKVTVLLGRKNVGVTSASMALLEVRKRAMLPCVGGRSQVVLVLKGRGFVSGGGRRRSLRPGVVAVLAEGKGAVFHRRGGRELELLHFFIPGGEQHWLTPPRAADCQQLPVIERLPARGRGFLLDRTAKRKRSRVWSGERLTFITRGSARTKAGKVVQQNQAVYLANTEQLQPGKRFAGFRLLARGRWLRQTPHVK